MTPLYKSKNILNNRKVIDYDIHGIVGIRLINPTAKDACAVANGLSQHQSAIEGEPDITIYFKEKLPTPALTYLGLDYAGFTDEGFYILSSKENLKVRIPFEKIGSHFEILCESGLHSLPWLFDLINFTLLKKNYLPLHASAFVYNGVGIVVTGWTKGGKTEALLSFANHGAHYVGDEWAILSGDGKEMFGIPVPICVWEWYFKSIPKLLPKVGMQRKILFKIIHSLDLIHRGLEKVSFKNSFPVKILGQALPSLKRQLNIRALPEELFKNRVCKLATPDKIILSISQNDPNIYVEECDPSEIAKRMISSNELEQAPFLEFYKAFKFAFPNLRNEFLENIDELQYALLCSAFANKKAYKVYHPYPVSLENLFNQLKPVCGKEVLV
jgi:hypothetical protein